MSERILPPARNEGSDVPFKYVLAGASGLALALAVVLLAAYFLFPDTLTDRYVAQPPRFADPQLQSSPRLDMDRFRAEQLKTLNEAYWLDQQHGVVHLPIDEAMRKLAAEGVQDWPAPKRTGQ
jgi:hypothetical protein